MKKKKCECDNILQKNFPSSLESHPKLLVDGQMMEKSNLSEQRAVKEDTCTQTSQKKSFKKKERKKLSMLESPLENNQMTLKDKLPFSNINIQPMKLSQTLVQESISKDEDLLPFWTESLQEKYQKLWLPTKTDSAGLALSYLNTSSTDLESDWKLSQILMLKNQQKLLSTTSYQSLQFLQPNIMDLENTTYTRKIRIYPNKEQRTLFKKCLGVSRYMYNQTVKNLKSKESLKGQLRLSTQRSEVIIPDKDLPKDLLWMKEVPYATRQLAVAEAISAYKGCLTKLKSKQIKKFNIKYRTKKQNKQTFRCEKAALKTDKMAIFITRLKKKSKLKFRKRDISKYLQDNVCDGEFIIQWIRPDKWYICLPKQMKRQPMIYTPAYKSVFLDPGVRTFQTFYSPDGIAGKIGDSITPKINQLCKKHDLLWSKSDSKLINSRTKKRLRDRCAKIRYKRKCIVSNLHNQTASLLCKNFETIFLPKFDTKVMTKKQTNLSSKISRKMLSLCHGEFREKMKYQCLKHKRALMIVNEAYTTKTCGNCGTIKQMQSLKTYKCGNCGCCMDRDYNGARNICLRVISRLGDGAHP